MIAQRVLSNPKYAKALHWAKLISLTGFAQVFVQATGMISGILIIRLLPTQEYALYTLANTMLGTMTMLADSGLSNGVIAEGGKVWNDRRKLGIVLATGLSLRKKYGIISLLVTGPILMFLLREHGASWITATIILLGLIPAFFAALSDSFLEMPPKLHQDIKPLQRNQAEVSMGRLVLSVLSLSVLPFTWVALIANSLPRIYGNYKLRKISANYVSNTEKADANVQEAVNLSVKRTLPIVLYSCISGQLSIWLISFLGTTSNIAELGALGRISLIFTLFNVLFSTLFVPRFARMKVSGNDILKIFLVIQVGVFLTSVSILFAIWLLSKQVLWIFGESYLSLSQELLLVGIAGSFGLMNGVCSQLTVSRGWYIRPHFLIGINIISTIISIIIFDVTTLQGVLYFNIVIAVLSYFLTLIYGFVKAREATWGSIY